MYVVLSIFSLVAALIAAGFFYQVIGSHRDRRRFAAPGRCVEIGPGHKLYMLEKGVGGPTVLFEAGIAATNLNWFHVQETVARFTHTVSYDRGGLGWSGPSRTARTPSNCAFELHDLLERADRDRHRDDADHDPPDRSGRQRRARATTRGRLP